MSPAAVGTSGPDRTTCSHRTTAGAGTGVGRSCSDDRAVAGQAVTSSRNRGGQEFAAGASFVLLAGSTVLVPVALRQAAGRRADPALGAVRALLTRHGPLISVALLLVVGAAMAVQGAVGLVVAVIPAG